jgi:hypothetical protein
MSLDILFARPQCKVPSKWISGVQGNSFRCSSSQNANCASTQECAAAKIGAFLIQPHPPSLIPKRICARALEYSL